jgi:hypothetical protein
MNKIKGNKTFDILPNVIGYLLVKFEGGVVDVFRFRRNRRKTVGRLINGVVPASLVMVFACVERL